MGCVGGCVSGCMVGCVGVRGCMGGMCRWVGIGVGGGGH